MDDHSARTSFWQEGNSKWLLLKFFSLPWLDPTLLPAWRNESFIWLYTLQSSFLIYGTIAVYHY